MYVVKSRTGYILDLDSLLMTSELEDAARMGHGEAAAAISRMEEQGFPAEAIRVSSSVVRLSPADRHEI